MRISVLAQAFGILTVLVGLISMFFAASLLTNSFLTEPYVLSSSGPAVKTPVVIRSFQKIESAGGIGGETGAYLKIHWVASGYGNLVVQIVDRNGIVVAASEELSGNLIIETTSGNAYWIIFTNRGLGDITLREAYEEIWKPYNAYSYSLILLIVTSILSIISAILLKIKISG